MTKVVSHGTRIYINHFDPGRMRGGDKEAPEADGDTAPPTAPADPDQYGDTGGLALPLVDKPTTINWMVVSENQPERFLLAKEIEKRTGIKVNFQAYSSATFQDKLKVTVASGKLPDIIHGLTPPELKKIGKQKAVVAINEYLDMPNFKNVCGREPMGHSVLRRRIRKHLYLAGCEH